MSSRHNSSRSPQVAWDTYHRQVLCCLYRFFDCSHDQLSVIFSTIFRSHLVHCGFGSSDVPYSTLNAQWSWLRAQRRPVWHHVHVATEFRTDGEWKEIIHRIRLTAFDLAILLREKRIDTIVIPDGDFDVNRNPCEYLTSVLLTSPARPQTSDNADTSVDAYVDSPMASVDTSSPRTPPSTTTYLPETPITDITQPDLESYMQYPVFRDDTPSRPTTQPPVLTRSPYAASLSVHNSTDDLEPLVTAHGKICFWCEREGLHSSGDTSKEAMIGVDENLDIHTQSSNDLSSLEHPVLDIGHMPSPDAQSLVLPQPDNHIGLPGLCGVGDVPPPPPLLYRWFNDNSQGTNTGTLLVAGWFTTTYPDVISPAELSEREFLHVFAAHVTRIRVPTPFISAFARPLTPVHRALRNRESAKISIIDPRKLLTPVFNARPLAQITGTTVARWKGYGEFVIWGCVPSEAIVCTFDIATLEDVTSWHARIRDFLQLSLIETQETCHRGVRRDLRTNLNDISYDGSQDMLMRLAHLLGVPEEYEEAFATDIHQAWTLDLGETWRDPEILHDSASSPVPAVSLELYPPSQSTERLARHQSESSISYMPPKSDGGSCSEETSEEEDDMSQSPEAPCPRRDTPSPEYSVANDTDDSIEEFHRAGRRSGPAEVEMAEVAIPTPPSTSRYFGRAANAYPRVQPINFGALNLSTALNDEEFLSENEWPCDIETIAGKETPTKSRYFKRTSNDGGNEKSTGHR